MNEVSIIINGVRYDAVESERLYACMGCEIPIDEVCGLCKGKIIFKKSDKKFEK